MVFKAFSKTSSINERKTRLHNKMRNQLFERSRSMLPDKKTKPSNTQMASWRIQPEPVLPLLDCNNKQQRMDCNTRRKSPQNRLILLFSGSEQKCSVAVCILSLQQTFKLFVINEHMFCFYEQWYYGYFN